MVPAPSEPCPEGAVQEGQGSAAASGKAGELVRLQRNYKPANPAVKEHWM